MQSSTLRFAHQQLQAGEYLEIDPDHLSLPFHLHLMIFCPHKVMRCQLSPVLKFPEHSTQQTSYQFINIVMCISDYRRGLDW
jgi:hypothetical protein